jgi:hypothetical protein
MTYSVLLTTVSVQGPRQLLLTSIDVSLPWINATFYLKCAPSTYGTPQNLDHRNFDNPLTNS